MNDEYVIQECPKCKQKLRFPTSVGGVVMVCPECGTRFYSDFRVKGDKRALLPRLLDCDDPDSLFRLPERLLKKLQQLWRRS